MKITEQSNNQIILKELARRIKDLRISMSLTQEDLAKKAGVSQRTITRFEAAENIKIEGILNILRALDCLSNVELLIPSQDVDLESIIKQKKKRQRATSKKPDTKWVWGDEK